MDEANKSLEGAGKTQGPQHARVGAGDRISAKSETATSQLPPSMALAHSMDQSVKKKKLKPSKAANFDQWSRRKSKKSHRKQQILINGVEANGSVTLHFLPDLERHSGPSTQPRNQALGYDDAAWVSNDDLLPPIKKKLFIFGYVNLSHARRRGGGAGGHC
ncbi:hypothetical protein NC653_015797 [Populus alba x Populus x berolinensis]|uniref:Uncharacterized protein n=1 Tax=Populus alba x Populus x berolinensis TaxID=444605 RepID=A0AAD6QLA8_9ROSI|nr:hypothetical protein NC653_015797 [Populus alba x Populus x berolinensis]